MEASDDVPQDDTAATPQQRWSRLDEAWQVAFAQAWEALRAGSLPIGACATRPDGAIVHAARNRVSERSGPPGEVSGSALAHAEINVLARLGYREPRELTLTTTLEPCIQCAAAIRLGPIATVRFAGADRLWDGCHEFSRLSPREAARPKVVRQGPRADEIGLFGRMISRFGPGLNPRTESYLRAVGEADILDLVARLEDGAEIPALAARPVQEAFAELWPDLRKLRAGRSAVAAPAD